MMRSLFSGVSGLKNHQTRMDVIGNNISNVNTTGFKSSRVNFADMISQTLTGASAPNGSIGGTNPKQIGLGSAVSSIDLLFTNGSVQSTGRNTDLCLSSTNSLFVLNTGNGIAYTRNGAFEFDADGNYVQSGTEYYVQGWMADENGRINKSSGGNITIPSGKSMDAKASVAAKYSNNLNAEIPTITNISGGTTKTETVLTLSNGRAVTVTSGSYAVGDTYPYQTTETHTATGENITVTNDNSPVTITLANGKTATPSTVDPQRSYGYSTATVGESATATATKKVIVTNGKIKAEIAAGNTVTVGGKCMVGSSTPGTVVKGTVDAPVELELADGTKHLVTDGSSYMVGTDTYTYIDPVTSVPHTSNIINAKQEITITGMDVLWTGGGNGTNIKVGGIASYETTTPGYTATSSPNNKVTLEFADGSGVEVPSGETYAVGGKYETEKVTTAGTTSDAATAAKPVKLYLSDGTTVEDSTSGLHYQVGDNYTVTQGGVPKVLQITGYSYLKTITKLTETSTITSFTNTKTENVTVTDVKTHQSTEASVANPVTLKMSDGSTVTQTAGRYTQGHSLPLTTTLTLYDSLGGQHDVTVYFTKTGVTKDALGNTISTWAVSLDTSHSVAGHESTQVLTGKDGTVTTLKMPASTVTFDVNGRYQTGSGQPVLTMTNGSSTPQTVSLDYSALTQYAGSNTIAGKADGNTSGTLTSVSIDKTGTITGTYTNGMRKTEAQVALQRFTNPGGLTKIGNSLYESSNNDGRIGDETSGKLESATDIGATITPSALEMSNVDVANEFTDMIITQRGFQSNSKIITVSDEMLETLIQMKR